LAAELVREAPARLDSRLAALRRVALVPAYNEAGSIGGVIDEIRSADPEIEIVVVDDGSQDDTAGAAAGTGSAAAGTYPLWPRGWSAARSDC